MSTSSPPTGLAAELGKKQPFDALEREAYLNLWRTLSLLDQRINRLMRPHKLTKVSYNILRILRGAGDTGCTGTEIASMLVADVPDMARLIDRLEKLSYIRRGRIDEDRRRVRNFLTQKGSSVLDAIERPLLELHQVHFSGLQTEELRTLIDLLSRVRETA